ncbi:MAG: hypothetical protein KJO07_05790 [Deltaproteobacteria bacterium]|jgi:hypothetical protein|nr:hypothetical protein [Deltaproteobacteria bacterium]
MVALLGCQEVSAPPLLAELEVNGFDHQVEYYHFGARDSQFDGPLVLLPEVDLGGESLQAIRFGIDMTTVVDDAEGVYDIQLVDVCGPDLELELERGGDLFATGEPGIEGCTLVRQGLVVGWVSGSVHFHSIDRRAASVTIPMTIGFSDLSEPDAGVRHQLRVAVDFDFTSPD